MGCDCSKVSQFPNFASLLTNCTYLENTSVEVNGYSMNIQLYNEYFRKKVFQVEGVNIYGSPHVPGIGHEWAFFYGKDDAEKVLDFQHQN